ncbi:MAG: PAS domain S-box protein [Prolixibacteraceae bacterium]
MKDNKVGKTYYISISMEEPFATSERQEILIDYPNNPNIYSPIFNQISDPVLVHDSSGNILFLNFQAQKLCKISSEEAYKFSISDLPSEFVQYQQCKSVWTEVLHGKTARVEMNMTDEQKCIDFELDISVQSVVWGGDKAIMAIVRGFSEAFNVNEEISELRSKNTSLQLELKTIFEKTSDGIFINDHIGNFIDVNENSCQLLGYSKDEILKLNIWDVVVKENREKVAVMFNEIRSGNAIVVEHELTRKDGTVFPAEICGIMLPDGRLHGVVKDISKLKNLENELFQAKETAVEYERLNTEFFRNMSHEIRTPLNAIVGFAELIPDSFDEQEKLIKFTNIIKEKGNDLIDIIDDILDFSNIESGQVVNNPSEYNMNALFSGIENYFSDYQRRMEISLVDFNIMVSQQIKALDVIIDHEKLKQVLINLVSNSFKFTSSGSIILGCELSDSEMFTFYVSDTGIGIPKEIQNDIFRKFTKANAGTSRIYGGTGIGLSIVQGLLNLMGGKIWIESEEFNGSTFYFSLPFQSIPKAVSKENQEMDYAKFSRSKFDVLIVEDNYYNTEYLQEILTDSNIRFQHTKSGQKAFEICSTEFVPVVLLNVRLTDMSGFEAAKQIKMLSPETQIIAQTTYVSDAEMEKAISSGCSEYLCSPVKPELLISKTNSFLRKTNDLSHK